MEDLKAVSPHVASCRGDVRSFEDCKRAVQLAADELGGRVSILVNCAAGNFLVSSQGRLRARSVSEQITDNRVPGKAQRSSQTPLWSLTLSLQTPASSLTPKGFKTVMEIDTLGTFHCCRAAYEDLKATKGLIVNVSMTLHYSATFFQAHACAAKASAGSTRGNASAGGEAQL